MFIKDFEKILDEGYEIAELIEGSFNNRKKIKIKHIVCGNIYEVNYHDYNAKRRCPFCAGRRRTTESVKKELFELAGDEYEMLSEYNGVHGELILLHKKCNTKFTTKYLRFFGLKEHHLANRCPKCFGTPKKTTEQFKNEVETKTNGKYTILSEYITKKDKIKFKHFECNSEYWTTPSSFNNGSRCPFCAEDSRGETKIVEWLRRNNDKYISFTTQKRFSDCKDKRPLPFDFFIKRLNGTEFLIEYHGIQHYQQIGASPFATEDLKIHDLIKERYCSENNIELKIIPYTDYFKLDEILEKITSSTIL